ncbi:MAG: HEAT repeat domain-containing protein [Gammaproteobacteria bacterium]|nr:HEAT repeat domain-containing protein [Gammaproteobacteria bacterium]
MDIEHENYRAFVAAQIARLGGAERRDAFLELAEMPVEVLPLLIEAYWHTHDAEARTALIRLVGQFRREESVRFLCQALDDIHDPAWMAALDALVDLGTPRVVRELRDVVAMLNPDDGRLEWVRLAMEQLMQSLSAARKDA